MSSDNPPQPTGEDAELVAREKPAPNPEWEAKAEAFHAASVAEVGVNPFDTLTMLETWKSDAEPANELGQVSFSRAMLDSATDALRMALEMTRAEYIEKKDLATRLAAVSAELEGVRDKVERELGGVIDERDEAQEALSQAYFLIVGRSPEWSNLFGVEEALRDIDDAQSILRETARTALASDHQPSKDETR